MTHVVNYLPEFIAMMGIGVTCIISVITGTWILSTCLNKIHSAIADIRENFVKEAECNEHRRNCPCVTDMAKIHNWMLRSTSFEDRNSNLKEYTKGTE